jgi:acyl-CoA synthetase (AMP-forming)/AMP-acid ligase II
MLLYDRPSTAGFATPFLNLIKVVGEDGSELGPNEIGVVAIKSTCNFRCYLKNEEATNEVLDDEGWFRSGDVGIIDEEGFLFIKDRIKDIVIRGGENIACLEIEAAIYEHPSVREASVFGVPDERLGEKLATRISLNPGAELSQ